MSPRLLLGVSLLVAACADDPPTTIDPTPPDAAATSPDAASDAAAAPQIAVTVEYAGTARGTLIVAAFASFPPQGPPLAFAQDASPTFPAVLGLDGVPAGTAYVLALLDVAPASPTQPGPEDRTAWSEAVELEDDEPVALNLTLSDPE